MIDVEVFNASLVADGPTAAEMRGLCVATAAHMGVQDGHVAIELVDAERIATLNAAHRGQAKPTDVLSFPIDGVVSLLGIAAATDERLGAPRSHEQPPRELGDIVICPVYTRDLREAVVHGMLHLLGMDHETDSGEMLALQRELLSARP